MNISNIFTIIRINIIITCFDSPIEYTAAHRSLKVNANAIQLWSKKS